MDEEKRKIQREKYASPGWAKIKHEHINWDYKPTLAANYLPEKLREELLSQEEGAAGDKPPTKVPRLKGRNQKRPPPSHKWDPSTATGGVKLCPSVINGRPCQYGPENCRFEHKIELVLATKVPDLPGDCYTFGVRGKCDYGPMCRFSKTHTSSEASGNVVDEERLASYQGTLNTMSRETQTLLRKRTYDFSPTLAALDRFGIRYKRPEGDLAQTESSSSVVAAGGSCEGVDVPLTDREKRKIDFAGKLYLAPLTTVGNLPFRRVCKGFGADITCGEMALSMNLLQGQQSEWALLKRHASEDIFGVQLCGAFPDTMTKCAQLLKEQCQVDFVDINCGCPLDLVYRKGEGSGLMQKSSRLPSIVRGMRDLLDCPLTVKLRTGIYDGRNVAHTLLPELRQLGVDLVTIHGRSREQRFTREADWDYIKVCAEAGRPMTVFGNGDVLSYEDYELQKTASGVDGIMIARGGLIKPWLFTEIKEQRHWDISSSERMEVLRDFTNFGLEHWGSDHRGVENTRKFLLEWLSFLHRYIPVGLLETLPQRINDRPPYFIGRDDLETMMGSANCQDWIKISEMLLGPVPDDFNFLPKHKANAYR